MRTAVFDRYGAPDVLRIAEVPTPQAGTGEVLVRIHATVATPSDVAFRSGRPWVARLFSGLTKPRLHVLGDAFAGVVAGVGAGVTGLAAGDRVAGSVGPGLGAYAQFALVQAAGAIVRIPDSLGFGEAAGLCDGGLTALPFLRDTGRVQPGQHVLINGASGCVGSTALQVAKAMGAIVTGATSSRNVELVRSLGADRVIDYTAEDFTASSSAYDVIFDTVGKSSFSACSRALKPEGIYLMAVPSLSPGMLRKSGRRARFAATGVRPPGEKAKDLQQLVAWAVDRRLRTVVGREFELDQIAEAHTYVETGRKVGSAVVKIH